MNALALLIAKGPQDRPTNHEVNHRFGTPPSFFESAAALCIGLKHGGSEAFLAMAVRLHHANMNGGTILVRPVNGEEAS
jgi:hypothetical protein